MCKKRLLSLAIILVVSVSLCVSACEGADSGYESNIETTNIVKKETTEEGDGDETTTSNGRIDAPEDEPGSKGLAYQPLSGGTCYISGIGNCTDSDICIPRYIDGYEVTGIGVKAFYKCSGFTSITIPNSVTSIGDKAFASCEGLTSITIPDRVTSIGYGTFWGCFSLTSIVIPASVTVIDDAALMGCPIKSIYFKGTRTQWNAITNYDNLNYLYREYTIYCSDGNIPK